MRQVLKSHSVKAADDASTPHRSQCSAEIFSVSRLPNGAAWAAALDQIPADRRHLELHRGHAVQASALDRTFVPRAFAAATTFTGTADQLRGRLETLAAKGVSEVTYQPSGSDVVRELKAFAKMVEL